MNTQTKTRDIVVTRRFNTPVANVWKAWSDPDAVMRWWGPASFTAPICKLDFREGGTTLVCMRAPDGQEFYNTWTYRKIVPMAEIEFVMNFADVEGTRKTPGEVGLPPTIPQDVRHRITFAAVDSTTTEMTVTEYGYTDDQVVEMSKLGLEQCIDKMAAMFGE
jgi:uncharacterized protein YndB with AHSA1/START domain